MSIRDYFSIEETDPEQRIRFERLLDWAEDKPEVVALAKEAFDEHGEKLKLYSTLSDRLQYVHQKHFINLSFKALDAQSLAYKTPEGDIAVITEKRAFVHELTHGTQPFTIEIESAVRDEELAFFARPDIKQITEAINIAKQQIELTPYFDSDELVEDILAKHDAVAQRLFTAKREMPASVEYMRDFESTAIKVENAIMAKYENEPPRSTDYMEIAEFAYLHDKHTGNDKRRLLNESAFPMNPEPGNGSCPIDPGVLKQINQNNISLADAKVDPDQDLSGCLVWSPSNKEGNGIYRDSFKK